MRKQVNLFFAILPDKKLADECSSKIKAASSSASKSVTSSISCVQKIIDIENRVIDDPESYYDKNFQPYFQDSLKGYFLKEVDDYLKHTTPVPGGHNGGHNVADSVSDPTAEGPKRLKRKGDGFWGYRDEFSDKKSKRD